MEKCGPFPVVKRVEEAIPQSFVEMNGLKEDLVRDSFFEDNLEVVV